MRKVFWVVLSLLLFFNIGPKEGRAQTYIEEMSESKNVPDRFNSEAFGKIATYMEKYKIMNIVFGKEKIVEVPDLKLKLNDKFLSFEQLPISKDNRAYIPLESIFDGLGKEIFWTRENDKISASIYGDTLEMFVNKNYAIVNGKKIKTTHYPIDYKGTIMVPIRFVGEAFGLTVHYNNKEKVIYIYMNQPKFKTPFLEKETIDIVYPEKVPTPKLVGNRRLMVSDNPEYLNNETVTGDQATLWHDTVKENKESEEHRVFGWHVNELNEEITIGITIENLSDTNIIEIKDLKGIHRTSPDSWSNYDIGLPIAETVLSHQLLGIKLDSYEVKPGQTILLDKYSVPKDHIIGFLADFTVEKVSGTEELNYRVSIVVSRKEMDLTAIKFEPLPLDRKHLHPRGVWPSSEIFLQLPTYQVGNGEFSYLLSNGITDNLMSEKESLDSKNSIQNPGHFGAVYKVRIPVVNQTGEAKIVTVRLASRGGLYNGAVKSKDGVFITPTLEPMKDVAKIVDVEVSNEEIIELEIMHAGGSALPIAINILTVD